VCIETRERREPGNEAFFLYIIVTIYLVYMYAGPPDLPRVSVDVCQGEIIFSWPPNTPNCLLIDYNITNNNHCGSCKLNGTTASCTNLTLSTVASICSLSVISMACGFSQAPSNPTDVIVKGMSSTII
jgi:hypothetical protein